MAQRTPTMVPTRSRIYYTISYLDTVDWMACTMGRRELGLDSARRGVELEAFKSALRMVAAPVTIITTLVGDRAHATTVSAFCSLSADPPMVLVCLDLTSNLLSAIDSSPDKRFAVHFVDPDHEELALKCASKDSDKLAGTSWQDVGGVPVIKDVGTWMSCELEQVFPAGDHMVLVGLVVDCSVAERASLVYRNRSFHSVG